jgi:hypothetical protein
MRRLAAEISRWAAAFAAATVDRIRASIETVRALCRRVSRLYSAFEEALCSTAADAIELVWSVRQFLYVMAFPVLTTTAAVRFGHLWLWIVTGLAWSFVAAGALRTREHVDAATPTWSEGFRGGVTRFLRTAVRLLFVAISVVIFITIGIPQLLGVPWKQLSLTNVEERLKPTPVHSLPPKKAPETATQRSTPILASTVQPKANDELKFRLTHRVGTVGKGLFQEPRNVLVHLWPRIQNNTAETYTVRCRDATVSDLSNRSWPLRGFAHEPLYEIELHRLGRYPTVPALFPGPAPRGGQATELLPGAELGAILRFELPGKSPRSLDIDFNMQCYALLRGEFGEFLMKRKLTVILGAQ